MATYAHTLHSAIGAGDGVGVGDGLSGAQDLQHGELQIVGVQVVLHASHPHSAAAHLLSGASLSLSISCLPMIELLPVSFVKQAAPSWGSLQEVQLMLV